MTYTWYTLGEDAILQHNTALYVLRDVRNETIHCNTVSTLGTVLYVNTETTTDFFVTRTYVCMYSICIIYAHNV